MFCKCCDEKKLESYSIIHKPTPIEFPPNMALTIKQLLWYVPNIDSYQAKTNDLIEDPTYDDFSFSFVMEEMGMIENQDVEWLEPSETIDENIWEYYENSICTHCQKIIIVKCKKQSKVLNLLRCIRNCIAHGHFAIVDDYFIGFNMDKYKSTGEIKRKAIIKIKPILLLSAINKLILPRSKELLIEFALKRTGYTILKEIPYGSEIASKIYYDVLAEKDGKIYIVEVKSCSGKRYLGLQELEAFIHSYDIPDNAYKVLFIDTSRVKKELREAERKIDNFIILDLTQIKQLFNGEYLEILGNKEAV